MTGGETEGRTSCFFLGPLARRICPSRTNSACLGTEENAPLAEVRKKPRDVGENRVADGRPVLRAGRRQGGGERSSREEALEDRRGERAQIEEAHGVLRV